MIAPPALRTARLLLDAFSPADVPELARLAGDRAVADTTLALPHPYHEADARRFLAAVADGHAAGSALTLAIRLADGPRLVGAIGLKDIDRDHAVAELGYWVGVPWWGRGIATEAARAVLAYAFDELGLNRVSAHHMVRNPASGKVLERAGMRREGLLRQRVLRWGQFEDVVVYGALRSDPRPA